MARLDGPFIADDGTECANTSTLDAYNARLKREDADSDPDPFGGYSGFKRFVRDRYPGAAFEVDDTGQTVVYLGDGRGG